MIMKLSGIPNSICGYILGGIFLLYGSVAVGQEISLSTSIDKTEMAFEDSLTLNLLVEWEGDMAGYVFEVFPLPETENLQVLGTSSAVSSRHENNREITSRKFRYTLRPTLAGVGIIRSIVLNYVQLPDSLPGLLTTQEYKVIISEPVVKPDESRRGGLFVVILIIGSVVIIAIMGLWFVRRRRHDRVPVTTAEEKVLDKLIIIKSESQTDRKQFYIRVYKTLATYIEEKFGLATSGRTSAAIIGALESIEIGLDTRDKLAGWLAQAEKEKYAPSGGEPGDTIRMITELEEYFQRLAKR